MSLAVHAPPPALAAADEALLEAAEAAAAAAYAPYSGFAVGAAVRAEDGTVFSACNVENAAFPVGQCAEANAVAAAVSAGRTRLVGVAVVGYRMRGPGGGVLAAPCGRCRQILNEFAADGDVRVLVRDRERTRLAVATIEELLPLAFGPRQLG